MNHPAFEFERDEQYAEREERLDEIRARLRDEKAERARQTEAACLERDLAAYECAGVLRALHESGQLPAHSTAPAALERYRAASAAIEAASGVRQEQPEYLA